MVTQLLRLYLITIINFTNALYDWKLQTYTQETTLRLHFCKYMNEGMGNSLLDQIIGDISPCSNSSASTGLAFHQLRFYKSFLEKMEINIPNLKEYQTWKFNLHPINGNHVFIPSYHNTIEAITKLLVYWKVENATFFIDNCAEINIKQLKAYLKISLTEVTFELITVDSKLDLGKQIIDLWKKYLNFVIICNADNTNSILKVIQVNNLLDTSLRLMIVSQTLPKVLQTTFISAESQVTLISTNTQIHDQTDAHHISYTRIYQENYSNHLCDELLKLEEHFSTELRISPNVYFYDVFYSFKTKQIEYIKFAYWTIEKGLFAMENLETNDLNERLKGRRIKLSAFQHLPYIDPVRINGTDYISGYKVEVMDMLMDYFNANHSLKVYSPDWGLIVNGSYTGLLGVIYRKETDVPVAGFAISYYRLKALRYLAPLTKLDISLAYTTPIPVIPPTTHVFPFTAGVWLSIAIALICIAVALAITMYFSPGWRIPTSPAQSSHSRLFRLITMTFFEEALENPPGSAAKVIFGTLLVATLAIFVFYTSVFTSFLAYRELKMPIGNLRDLVDNKDYMSTTVKGSVYEAVLRYAQNGIFYDLWKKMGKNERLSIRPNVFSCIDRMYTSKTVMLIDGASIIAATKNNCSMSLIRTAIFREYLFLVTRNDFPYSRMFYIRLLKIIEGGLINRLSLKYMTGRRPPCDIQAPSLSLGILQVVGLFFLLSCGIALSLLMLILEKVQPNVNI